MDLSDKDAAWVAEQTKKFSFVFDDADKDKSGDLRFAELTQALVAAGYHGNYWDTKKIFTEFDVDSDKRISKDEFKKLINNFPVKQLKTAVLESKFQSMDADKSGFLSKQELMDAVKKEVHHEDTKQISQMLINLVTDKDGKIDYKEFLAVYAKTK